MSPIHVGTESDMRALGAGLAGAFRAGDVMALVGPLGAGKTTLVRGLAMGLDVREPVSSPTFVICRRHEGGVLDLQHCDAYRLGSADEFDDLALDLADCVTVVEWGADYCDLLSDDWLEVRIVRGEGLSEGEGRTVDLVGHGQRWHEDLVRELTSGLVREVVSAGGRGPE